MATILAKGEWIPTRKFDFYYKCSVCNEIGPLEPEGEGVYRFNFCPNCIPEEGWHLCGRSVWKEHTCQSEIIQKIAS